MKNKYLFQEAEIDRIYQERISGCEKSGTIQNGQLIQAKAQLQGVVE